LWGYRDLFYYLTWRDVKVRYKQAALGAAWAVLQPLFMMAVFTIFFGRAAAGTTLPVPYPLFALTGLVPWTFLSNAVGTGSNSLVGNANLLSKVYFPRLLVPTTTVAACLVDFALAFVMLAGVVAYYGVAPTPRLLALPALVLICALLALAVGTWLAALNVKYRDVRFVLPFAIQLWLFASSVIMPASAVPARWRWLLTLNPVAAIIEGFRSSLLGLPFDWPALGTAAAATLLGLACSVRYFMGVESQFADVI
jgi:lipopolysaccharide transport system permease protein